MPAGRRRPLIAGAEDLRLAAEREQNRMLPPSQLRRRSLMRIEDVARRRLSRFGSSRVRIIAVIAGYSE